MSMKKAIPLGFLVVILGAALVWFLGKGLVDGRQQGEPAVFSGERALKDVEYQVSLGPRLPGSAAHNQTVDWISRELKSAGWEAEIQETTQMGNPVRNVVGRWGKGNPWILIGAHFDSRLVADQDPLGENRTKPVPGANDGASGVGVLLELARILPERISEDSYANQVWLVFFDAEDNGRIPGWDWILGSRAFAAEMEDYPDSVVVVDMIGDADLNIYQELNSDSALTEEIWQTAAGLGYDEFFIPQPKYRILDDHTPFAQLGIPAVDIIDFDYPYWHTVEDTPDKVSAESLKVVGDTLVEWLSRKH